MDDMLKKTAVKTDKSDEQSLTLRDRRSNSPTKSVEVQLRPHEVSSPRTNSTSSSRSSASPRHDVTSPQLSPASSDGKSSNAQVFTFKTPATASLLTSQNGRQLPHQVNPLLAAQAFGAQKCFNPYELAHVMHLRAVAAAQFQQAYIEQRMLEKQRLFAQNQHTTPDVVESQRRLQSSEENVRSVTSPTERNRRRPRVRSFAIDDILQKPRDTTGA